MLLSQGSLQVIIEWNILSQSNPLEKICFAKIFRKNVNEYVY